MMSWFIVLWVAVIGGALWLFSGRGPSRHSDALELLQRRLANGEIDVDEFQRREQALVSGQRRSSRAIWIWVAITAVGLFAVIPVIAMASSGWDMWDMHGHGRNTAGSPLVRAGERAEVTIEDYAFSPGNLELPIGAMVTWTNKDSAPHDATARNGGWQTARLSEDESDTLTFDVSGEYNYYCSIHPSMRARIVVR